MKKNEKATLGPKIFLRQTLPDRPGDGNVVEEVSKVLLPELPGVDLQGGSFEEEAEVGG